MKRQLRVGEEIRHIITDVMRHYYWQDELLRAAYLNVTEVKISPDLKNATIFVLPLNAQNYDSGKSAALIKSLNGEIVPLRKELARKAYLKFVPKIHFVWDNAYDESGVIENLLKKVISS